MQRGDGLCRRDSVPTTATTAPITAPISAAITAPISAAITAPIGAVGPAKIPRAAAVAAV